MSYKLLSGAEKQNIVHISTSSANKTLWRNYVFSKYGMFLNGLRAAYIVSKESLGAREGKEINLFSAVVRMRVQCEI